MSKKILIAEDERPLAHALELKLKSEGYDVAVVGNGKLAIDSMKSSKPDLLLLDLVMPVLDGFGVLEEMQKEKISVPVIVSTNLSQKDDKDRVLKLGAKAYYVKAETGIEQVVEYVKHAIS